VVNKPHAFKDSDVQRVIRAARSAGLNPTAVEVDPKTGKIKVTSDSTGDAGAGAEAAWDEATKKLNAAP
jgi:hypothetical protein